MGITDTDGAISAGIFLVWRVSEAWRYGHIHQPFVRFFEGGFIGGVAGVCIDS